MIDTLLRPPAVIADPPPMEALPADQDEDEDMDQVWAALERSVGYERPSRASDVVTQ